MVAERKRSRSIRAHLLKTLARNLWTVFSWALHQTHPSVTGNHLEREEWARIVDRRPVTMWIMECDKTKGKPEGKKKWKWDSLHCFFPCALEVRMSKMRELSSSWCSVGSWFSINWCRYKITHKNEDYNINMKVEMRKGRPFVSCF